MNRQNKRQMNYKTEKISMRKISSAFLLIMFFSVSVSAQTNAEIKARLNKSGISEISCDRSLQDDEYEMILNFDFSQYREYNKKRKVQILNGPLLELSSLQEQQQQGILIDANVLEAKRKAAEYTTHEIIPQVDVGIRKIKAAYVPELENKIKKTTPK